MNMNPERESYQPPTLKTQKSKPGVDLTNIKGVDKPLVEAPPSASQPRSKGLKSTRGSTKGPRTTQRKETVSFNLDKCVVEAVEDYCIEEDMTKSKFVNEALKMYAEKKGIEIDFDRYRQRKAKK